jgi:hypothetical protein
MKQPNLICKEYEVPITLNSILTAHSSTSIAELSGGYMVLHRIFDVKESIEINILVVKNSIHKLNFGWNWNYMALLKIRRLSMKKMRNWNLIENLSSASL